MDCVLEENKRALIIIFISISEHYRFSHLICNTNCKRRVSSSGMLCHVALVRTNILEERISVIGVTRLDELGTMLAATSSRSMLCALVAGYC
jgi:hypothetical protein